MDRLRIMDRPFLKPTHYRPSSGLTFTNNPKLDILCSALKRTRNSKRSNLLTPVRNRSLSQSEQKTQIIRRKSLSTEYNWKRGLFSGQALSGW